MLTLSANSETLVNDFNDLSIKNDIYDSHKVSEYANGVDDDFLNSMCVLECS